MFEQIFSIDQSIQIDFVRFYDEISLNAYGKKIMCGEGEKETESYYLHKKHTTVSVYEQEEKKLLSYALWMW